MASDGRAAHAQYQRKWWRKRTEKSDGRRKLAGTGFSCFSVADFHFDKFMQMSWCAQYGNDYSLGRQLKAEWLYDISWVPRPPTPGLQHRGSSSGKNGGTDWRFIVSLQRIATCGINYAAIMSFFVAMSFGLSFMKVSE